MCRGKRCRDKATGEARASVRLVQTDTRATKKRTPCGVEIFRVADVAGATMG